MMKEFVQVFCQAAKASGMEKLNFYMIEQQKRDISVYEDKLESLERSELNQLYIQALVNGKMGSIFVENFDTATIPELIDALKEDAELCSDAFVPYDLTHLAQTDREAAGFLNLTDVVDALIRSSRAASQFDSRIRSGIQVHLSEIGRRVTLGNEAMIFVSDVESIGNAGIYLVAQEGELVKNGGKGKNFRGAVLPDVEAMAKEAAQKALSSLGAGSCATGSYPVVLDARVMGELLDAFMPAFFGRNVHSRMSVLAGRRGEQIAGENIYILEDPSLPGGFCTRSFDDEGVPTQAKAIVEKGILKTYLHNQKSAHQEGCLSGGNGFKPTFHEEPATGYTNVYIPGGGNTKEQLLEALGEGLLITHVSGVFAGAKPNSGDFSLISSGYRVQGGKLGKAVSQITIAGNFFEMLRDVAAIGSDENWKCAPTGCIRTPSVLVRHLAISGKEDA